MNLLVEEGIIQIVSTTKEKVFSLVTSSSRDHSIPITLKLKIPKDETKKNNFFLTLKELIEKSDYFFPNINPQSLKTDDYITLTLLLEPKENL